MNILISPTSELPRLCRAAVILVATFCMTGCACLTVTTPQCSASYCSFFHDFTAKRISATINTNGLPVFTVSDVNDSVSAQTAAIVQGVVQGTIAGLK